MAESTLFWGSGPPDGDRTTPLLRAEPLAEVLDKEHENE
jgi:hypothetical protein